MAYSLEMKRQDDSQRRKQQEYWKFMCKLKDKRKV